MGKGDWTRPHDRKKMAEGFDRVFGEKPLNVVSDEEREALLREQADLARRLEGGEDEDSPQG